MEQAIGSDGQRLSIPAGASGLPCDEECEMREIAEWEGHFVQQCKQHPWVIRTWCGETNQDTRTAYARMKTAEVITQ